MKRTYLVTVGVTVPVEVLVTVPGRSVCVWVCVVDGVGMSRQEQALDTACAPQDAGRPVGRMIPPWRFCGGGPTATALLRQVSVV